MLKNITNPTKTTPFKKNLTPLKFSRIFVLKTHIILIYDDFILIDSTRINFKCKSVYKIGCSKLCVSDGITEYVVDVDKCSFVKSGSIIKDNTSSDRDGENVLNSNKNVLNNDKSTSTRENTLNSNNEIDSRNELTRNLSNIDLFNDNLSCTDLSKLDESNIDLSKLNLIRDNSIKNVDINKENINKDNINKDNIDI